VTSTSVPVQLRHDRLRATQARLRAEEGGNGDPLLVLLHGADAAAYVPRGLRGLRIAAPTATSRRSAR
jgi:hypothetical protein